MRCNNLDFFVENKSIFQGEKEDIFSSLRHTLIIKPRLQILNKIKRLKTFWNGFYYQCVIVIIKIVKGVDCFKAVFAFFLKPPRVVCADIIGISPQRMKSLGISNITLRWLDPKKELKTDYIGAWERNRLVGQMSHVRLHIHTVAINTQ